MFKCTCVRVSATNYSFVFVTISAQKANEILLLFVGFVIFFPRRPAKSCV